MQTVSALGGFAIHLNQAAIDQFLDAGAA